MPEGVDNPVFYNTDDALQLKKHAEEQDRNQQTDEITISTELSSSLDTFEEGPCGWGSFTPSVIQCCNNPKGYLVFYSLLGVMQGASVNGLINVSISTIEKRYQLSSSRTGVISASYDIAFCVLSLFVSFSGERGHKPRWMAFSAFMIGLGALVFSLPHFSSGLYEYGAEIRDTCIVPGTNVTNPFCGADSDSTLYNYLYVFILGQLLMGVGGTPLYTLGTAFIDDSVPTHKSSLYIGIGYCMSVLGPAVGYLLGGQFLNLYIDINHVNSVLHPDDSRWLGAWWIGFLICCFISWCLVLPFSCFPKHLPGTAKIQAEKVSQAHNDGSENIADQKNIGKSFKGFPVALMLLLKNPVFMCLTIASAGEGLITNGFVTFLPKFIENQFGQTSSFSALLGGSIIIPGAAAGQLLGGIVIFRLKMTCRQIIGFSAFTSIVSFVLSSVFIFSKCGNALFAGVTEYYNGTGVPGNLSAPCNAHCNCVYSHFEPICGVNDIQYFNPCFAGCTVSVIDNGKQAFGNCSCIRNTTIISPGSNVTREAYEGKCNVSCNKLPQFLSIFLILVIFMFMTATPITTSILRCVPDKERSFALGVQWLFIRLLGSIPGPVLFGVAIDNSCILWNIDECGTKGACWTYDNPRMSDMLLAISGICKAITILFIILAFVLYKPPSEGDEYKEKDVDCENSSCTNPSFMTEVL